MLYVSLNLSPSCRKGHDLKAYLDSKPADMHFPQPNSYSVDPPFVLPPAETDPILCPTFQELGQWNAASPAGLQPTCSQLTDHTNDYRLLPSGL